MLIPWMNRFYSPKDSFSSWTVWAMSVSELEGTSMNFSVSSFMWLNRGSKITQSVTGLVSLQPQCAPPSLCPAWGNGCHDLQQPVYAVLEIRTQMNQQRCVLSLEIPRGSPKVSWTELFLLFLILLSSLVSLNVFVQHLLNMQLQVKVLSKNMDSVI